MNVLYDYLAFDMQRVGGVSRCFVENYKHMSERVHVDFGVVESDNVYLRELGYRPFGFAREHFICNKEFPYKGYLFRKYNKIRGRYYGWDENIRESIRLLTSGAIDLLHPTFYGDYFLPYLKGMPFVLTIHDMITELYPQFYSANNGQNLLKKKLAPLAAKIITVSECTKKDVVRILNVPEQKVEVVYHGVNEQEFASESECPFKFPYVLYVGDRDNYKNFYLMCKYLIPVFEKYSDLKMVCTGHPFTIEEKNWMDSIAPNRFVDYFANTSQEMFTLYHNAEAFVYPSDYEGFGIPILEAYQAQCPVLLHNASCFPEIAGEAAVYFTLREKQSDFAEALMSVLEMHNEEKEALIKAQNARLSCYSWKRSAEQLENIYQSVI